MEPVDQSTPNPIMSGADPIVGQSMQPQASPLAPPITPGSLPSVAPVGFGSQAGVGTAPVAPVLPPTSVPAEPVPTANSGQSSSAPSSHSQHAPGIAEDVDLIEKEWVHKAKAIVDSTRGNPNEQSKEMSRFKADYLKTRYSKDLKVSD